MENRYIILLKDNAIFKKGQTFKVHSYCTIGVFYSIKGKNYLSLEGDYKFVEDGE